MRPIRAGVECGARQEEVLQFLASGAGLPYHVERVDQSAQTVVFKSGASLFSWGERVEVSVVRTDRGCTILFRGSGVHPINLTADPRGVVDRIALALEERFGPIQPIG